MADLFAVELDTDNYAETLAEDTPTTVDRTFQSEQDFQTQKAAYSAKMDQGNLYEKLIKLVPELVVVEESAESEEGGVGGGGGGGCEKIKLQKKEIQLLGYAVGEMYYERQYEEIMRLCRRVRERCWLDRDRRLGESLGFEWMMGWDGMGRF